MALWSLWYTPIGILATADTFFDNVKSMHVRHWAVGWAGSVWHHKRNVSNTQRVNHSLFDPDTSTLTPPTTTRVVVSWQVTHAKWVAMNLLTSHFDIEETFASTCHILRFATRVVLVWLAAYGWPLGHDLRLCTVRCTLVSACSLCFMSHCIFCLLMGVWALLTRVWTIDDDSFRHAFLHVVCIIPKSLNIARFTLLCSCSLCLTGLWAIVFFACLRGYKCLRDMSLWWW